jgi:hypothetical protein
VVSGPEITCETLANHLKETRGAKCLFIRGSIYNLLVEVFMYKKSVKIIFRELFKFNFQGTQPILANLP